MPDKIKRYPYKHQSYRQDRQTINDKLSIDWSKYITTDGFKHFFQGNPLLSVSTLLSGLNSVKFAKIPDQALNTAQMVGSQLMEWLEHIHTNKLKYSEVEKLNFQSEQIKQMVLKVFEFLALNDFKILEVEKMLCNGFVYGYADLVVYDKVMKSPAIIEIKTRSNNDLQNTDIVQVATYGRMIHNQNFPVWVLIINKKTFNISFHRVRLNHKVIKAANGFISAFLDKKYCI